jgi:hypothetical protein
MAAIRELQGAQIKFPRASLMDVKFVLTIVAILDTISALMPPKTAYAL